MIDFRFNDKDGKAQDPQHAAVDTRVAPRGRLVIWLMGYNAVRANQQLRLARDSGALCEQMVRDHSGQGTR